MIDLARVCSIVYNSIYLPTRWLAKIIHKLYSYNWFVLSMGRMADIIYKALEYISSDVRMNNS